jgi:hypothetical protein
MKAFIYSSLLALCVCGCAHTPADMKAAADEEWAQWNKIQIQSSGHGTFSPTYLVEVAKAYLKTHQIAVDDVQPVVDVVACTPERIGFVKFRQGEEHVCAVEIAPDGTAVRHHDIRVAR